MSLYFLLLNIEDLKRVLELFAFVIDTLVLVDKVLSRELYRRFRALYNYNFNR